MSFLVVATQHGLIKKRGRGKEKLDANIQNGKNSSKVFFLNQRRECSFSGYSASCLLADIYCFHIIPSFQLLLSAHDFGPAPNPKHWMKPLSVCEDLVLTIHLLNPWVGGRSAQLELADSYGFWIRPRGRFWFSFRPCHFCPHYCPLFPKPYFLPFSTKGIHGICKKAGLWI